MRAARKANDEAQADAKSKRAKSNRLNPEPTFGAETEPKIKTTDASTQMEAEP